jgi:excisionase family DNA binding protein
MKIRDAAAYLAISERTLWTLTHHEKKIPAVKIGRRGIRYDLSDLDAFINKAKGGGNVGEK